MKIWVCIYIAGLVLIWIGVHSKKSNIARTIVTILGGSMFLFGVIYSGI